MPRYDYVLFDADNTLYDFDKAEGRALRQVLVQHGYPADEAVCQTYYKINRVLWDRFDRGEIRRESLVVERFALLAQALGGNDDPDQFNQDYLERLAQGGDLLPGAEALCRALAPVCTLAIVTNGVAVAQRGRFSRSPLPKLIPYLFISEELGCQKPQREFFEAVLGQMGIQDPSRAVVVGDNLTADIGGGRNAGLNTIWYNPGHREADPDLAPTWDAPDFKTVERVILG